MIVEDVTNVKKSKGMPSNFRVCPSVAENKSRFYLTSRDSGDMQNKFWLPFHVSSCHIRLPHPFPRLDECTTELFPCVQQTRASNSGAFQDPAVLDFCVCRKRLPDSWKGSCMQLSDALRQPDAWNGVTSSHSRWGFWIQCLQNIFERSMWKIDSWRDQPSFSCYLIRGYIIPYNGPFCTLSLRFLWRNSVYLYTSVI